MGSFDTMQLSRRTIAEKNLNSKDGITYDVGFYEFFVLWTGSDWKRGSRDWNKGSSDKGYRN
jgi:hypothetical protein